MCFTPERTKEEILEKFKKKVLGSSSVFFFSLGVSPPPNPTPTYQHPPPHFLLQYGFSDNQERGGDKTG